MPLFNGTNAPTLSFEVNLDNTGKFVLGYSTLQATTGDVLGTQTDSWTALPITDVRLVSVRRGRTRENQSIQPGSMTVVIDNRSGNYDPDNTASPYRRRGYSYFVTGTMFRVKATWSGVDYILFTGEIESTETTLDLDPVTTLHCVDRLAWISRQTITAGRSFVYETTLSRLQNLLAIAGYTGTVTSSSGTTREMAPSSVAEDTPAQQLLDDVIASDDAFAYMTGADVYRYESFESTALNVNRFTLSDARTNGTIEYDQITSEPGSLYMINQCTLTTEIGLGLDATWTVSSETVSSSGVFGTFPMIKTLGLQGFDWGAGATDAGAQALADHYAQQNATPATRISFISWECVGVGFGTSAWAGMLTADLGERCTVNRTTVDGRALSYTCQLQAINHDITPDSWRMSVQLSPGA